MGRKSGKVSIEPLSPVGDLSAVKPVGGVSESPEVVIVFELTRGQYARAREHFDHLIDNHDISASVHFEDEL